MRRCQGKSLHWHIDQLTERGTVTGIWPKKLLIGILVNKRKLGRPSPA
jgi:Uri superfamily endonuclease